LALALCEAALQTEFPDAAGCRIQPTGNKKPPEGGLIAGNENWDFPPISPRQVSLSL
jgi:hypothetical protein